MLNILSSLLLTLWLFFGAYCLWFFIKAANLQPLSLDELIILWKTHKQHSGCVVPLSEVEPIFNKNANQFVGFKCKCGFEHLSKKLITQRSMRSDNMFDLRRTRNGYEHIMSK